MTELKKIKEVHILADQITDRLGVLSFFVNNFHHNLIVKILNDRFGIQVRGGCSCAGTYGHYLLNLDIDYSKGIVQKIKEGVSTLKPGWVRISIHPLMTDDEAEFIVNSLKETIINKDVWSQDYTFDMESNQYFHKSEKANIPINDWFNFG